jgi:pimeloyl-ACP methyl ester carboxylesterase
MGGIVATQGAARCPERVAALVYVAAFLPKDGQSLLDLTKLPEGDGEQVLANVVVEGEPPVAVMPDRSHAPAVDDERAGQGSPPIRDALICRRRKARGSERSCCGRRVVQKEQQTLPQQLLLVEDGA